MEEPVRVTPEIAAEAAVWVTRLHGDARSPRMESDCREWLARSPAHRLAFARITDTWQEVPNLKLADAYASAALSRPELRIGIWRSGPARWALAAVLILMVGSAALYLEPWRSGASYNTEVGGQQMVMLADGTRMSLNTNTHARVELGSTQRTVEVDRGEALFEVAKDPSRPFVVRVAGSEVVAVGTVFSVKLTADGARANDQLAVTLIEGQVTLRAADGAGHGVAPSQPVRMNVGERVRLSDAKGVGTAQVDRPRLEQVTAWKRSEAVFDNVSLAEAVAEMNRYSRTQIVLLDASVLEARRVSGVFRTGDNPAFARAVAALHGLVVHEKGSRLELAPS